MKSILTNNTENCSLQSNHEESFNQQYGELLSTK